MLDAYWHPLYDLYTTSDNGKPSTAVSFHYRVNLQQSTGEDWTNAKLILSTSATDILNAGIPKPDNLVVAPLPSLVPEDSGGIIHRSFVTAEAEESSDDDRMACCLFDDGPTPPISPAMSLASEVSFKPKLAQSAAVVSKSPMVITYTVEALTTIPSDGVSCKVLVAIIPFEAVFTHITTPGRVPIAYLQVVDVAL